MLFRVCEMNYNPDKNLANRAYLIKDKWNDWWQYITMFFLQYVDNQNTIHDLGSVKIGEFGLIKGSPGLPKEFEQLDRRFFSLGQSDDYYQALNDLGEVIRNTILNSLNDIALKTDLYEKAMSEYVTTSSLLRDISTTTVTGQFRRMANGGARLTPYYFTFTPVAHSKTISTPMELSFEVSPESNPPTNIHVIIGRNGVGKTHLIQGMIQSLLKKGNTEQETGVFSIKTSSIRPLFANVVCVAFSAFDEFPLSNTGNDIPYVYIGLEQNISQVTAKQIETRLDLLKEQFVTSLVICLRNRAKSQLWENAVKILESDPMFEESDVRSVVLCENDVELKQKSGRLFKKLSSGHKIILLTITRLVQTVEECTLVMLDEPETHLHPPLLAAFIRALSDLLINRNGVAIITTHSPVILQEVPRSCAWKLRRTGLESIAERLEIESFGENISSLTSEVFGLEVTYSGFHNILLEYVNKHGTNYSKILHDFNNELGMEAKAILKALIATYQQEDMNEDA